ncbi:Protein of unknown function [Marinobacter sp. es.048]|uniref:DUF1302 domain-containing protein n=1 Tax=Marinobacter sp. es.048 TaxID=1761795 RepID=UPI000B72BF26|nr:DUF1302 domain-containing protein [Marinobacter sp. es.048]SNC62733.1 Protein of unknown function [Marinobacter sp. es.048]
MLNMKKASWQLAHMALSAAMLTAAGEVYAVALDTGNPDVRLRWDNTVRYNLGVRAESKERALAESATQQIADNKFDRGDVVTNRLDIISELDLVYKRKYGARISAAGWYDNAYTDTAKNLPQYESVGIGSAYPGEEYTDTVKRYYIGPSGEILDAFVFGGVNLFDTPVTMRLGQHNLYWGESLFSFVHGVSYAQGPVDLRKATATPGIEAQELFLPLNQASATAQITDSISLAAYYQFEWEPSRLPEGGTYFGAPDFLFSGGTRLFLAPNFSIPVLGDRDTPDDGGAWGASLRWRTSALGTLGFYYREFDDTLPNVVADYSGPVPTNVYNKYAEDVKLFGLSLARQVGDASIGVEVVRREDTALASVGLAPDFARGDTWHALVNAIMLNGKNALWDSSTLQAELTYSYLDRVTENPQFYNKEGSPQCNATVPGANEVEDGCSTRSSVAMTVSFEPVWYQAMNGVDLTLPLVLGVGVYGNSPVVNGGNEGAGNFSVGVGADYLAKYKFNLAYNGFFGSISKDANGIQQTSNGGTPLLRDRGWLSFTAKATF